MVVAVCRPSLSLGPSVTQRSGGEELQKPLILEALYTKI